MTEAAHRILETEDVDWPMVRDSIRDLLDIPKGGRVSAPDQEPMIVPVLLHVRDGKVLFVRKGAEDLAICPGGKLEPPESLHGALVREIREELGCAVDSETIRFAGTFRGRTVTGRRLSVYAYYAKMSGTPRPQAEIAEIVWLGAGDGHLTTQTGRMVLAYLSRVGLIT